MRGRAIRCVWTAMSGACGFNIMSNAFKSHDAGTQRSQLFLEI